MKRMIMLVLALAVLAGCNTMRGVGQDVEKAGEAIQRKADK
ncbi:MAG: entericidin A/B family lipoprotein [Burkholderiales bacterium]|nr:entericidin A/B family lipoprotein [Burkholderiales bacterium]